MMVSLEVSIPVRWKGKEHGKAHMKGCMEYGHITSAHTFFWLEIHHTKLQGRLGNVPRKKRTWIMLRASRPCHTPLFPVLSMVEFPVSQGLSFVSFFYYFFLFLIIFFILINLLYYILFFFLSFSLLFFFFFPPFSS